MVEEVHDGEVSSFPIHVLHRGVVEYCQSWTEMRLFTEQRLPSTPDEFWLLEHPAVFTLGQAGRRDHLLATGNIPVQQSDRGGQVTYHGPGQLVVYVLMDLRRSGHGIKRLVACLEQAVLDLMSTQAIEAERRAGAPGVYVAGRKLAAIGLRVRKGCTYHGIAINVDMDTEPFSRINPCGYAGLQVTQLRDLGIGWSVAQAGEALVPYLLNAVGRRLQRSQLAC